MAKATTRTLRSRQGGLQLPATISGIVALLGLLPRVSRLLTALLVVLDMVFSILPLAVTVAAGLLVGSVPAAVRAGIGSEAGQQTLTLLGIAALLIVAERLVGPFQAALAAVLGRRVDRHLQERTMPAVGRPPGIAHLEDPSVLDLIESARGVGMQGLRPGDAVAALASLLPSWAQALGSAAILTTFRCGLGSPGSPCGRCCCTTCSANTCTWGRSSTGRRRRCTERTTSATWRSGRRWRRRCGCGGWRPGL